MLAMLRHVVYEGLRTRSVRRRPFFLTRRVRRMERPFDRELAELANAAQGAVRIVRVLSDIAGAEEGADYDAMGRIDMALLSRFLPFNDYDFYLCGPPSFTQALYDGLRAYNIADARIHAEAFGPSSLVRKADAASAAVPPRRPAATKPVSVVFTNT